MPELNEVRLTYIGGPTVLIEMGGIHLLTDPTFDPPRDYQAGAFRHSKLIGPAIDASAFTNTDAVLLSHDHHFDNLDRIGRKLLKSARQVITTPEAAGRLQANAVGLESWQSISIPAPNGKAVRITGAPARHGPAVGERGAVTGFLIS